MKAVSTGKKPNWLDRARERFHWTSRHNKIALAAAVVAIFLGIIGYNAVRPAYRKARMHHYIEMAEDAANRSDYRSASLAFRKAVLSGQENPEVWKALARFLEKVASPEVISVYDRLAALEPDNPDHIFGKAEAALRFDRVGQAEQTVLSLPESQRETPRAWRILASVCLRKQLHAEAAEWLKKVVEKEPEDSRARFDLLLALAKSDDVEIRSDAAINLRRFADEGGPYASDALRFLIAEEVANNATYEAGRLAEKLVARPDVTAKDWILYAQIEQQMESFTFALTLSRLREFATRNPDQFLQILDWLLSSKADVGGTIRWLNALPENVRLLPPVALALFNYHTMNGDIRERNRFLEDPDSPLHIPPKVFELAMRAIAEDEAQNPEAEKTWKEAVYAAEGKPLTIRLLALLASARGWSSALGRAAVALTSATPSDPSAWMMLAQHENSSLNLPGLLQALQGLLRVNPYDVNIGLTWAQVATLLKKGDPAAIREVAERSYRSASPSSPRAARIYALVLLSQGQPREALEVIEQMSFSDLRSPESALYVGAVMAANGRMAEALDYFKRSEDLSPKLFPAEIALRRVWKDVALGFASTAEEAEERMKRAGDGELQAELLKNDLRRQIDRRADPAEVRRILSELRVETETRKQVPPEVAQLLRDVRKEREDEQRQSPTPVPTGPR